MTRLAAAAVAFVLCAGAAACSGQDASGSPGRRLALWVSSSALGATVATVEADNARIDTLVNEHRPAAAVNAACSLLVSDLSTGAAGELPAPDREVTSDLTRAFDDEAAAASACADHPADPAVLAAAHAKRAKAHVLMEAALDRVAAVTGSVPDTSTTAAPPQGPAL